MATTFQENKVKDKEKEKKWKKKTNKINKQINNKRDKAIGKSLAEKYLISEKKGYLQHKKKLYYLKYSIVRQHGWCCLIS